MVVRVRFLGKTLAVERANKSIERDKYRQSEPRIVEDSVSLINDATAKEFGGGSRRGPYPGSEPIAERLGVDYPFPPHLEYVFSYFMIFLTIFLNFYPDLVDKCLEVAPHSLYPEHPLT